MANLSIARPYAKAAFEYAVSQDQIAPWGALLVRLAELVQTPEVSRLLLQPGVTPEQLKQFFYAACGFTGQAADKEAPYQHYIALLLKNRRVMLAPQIARLFHDMQAAYEAALTVEFITAHANVDNALLARLEKVLTKKYNKKVEIEHQVDQALLGGAFLRVGDSVMDGSLRGKLAQLKMIF